MPTVNTESTSVTIPELTVQQSVPVVVASGVLTPTGNMSATTIYTPTASGVFRVSVYLTGTPPADIDLAWTDSKTSQSFRANSNTVNGSGSLGSNATVLDFVIQSEADAIQIDTAQGNGSVTYAISYVVTQLA